MDKEEANSIKNEVEKTLKKMTIGKAIGSDYIPTRMDMSTSLKVQQEVS